MGLAKGIVRCPCLIVPSAGWGGHGKLGERGIHWWDAILHVDDWPSALYLAGVIVVRVYYLDFIWYFWLSGRYWPEPIIVSPPERLLI